MNYLRQLCATVTLICAFAFSAYAGNIECDGFTSVPPDYALAEVVRAVIESMLLLS